ncbi:LysR family transcriptional regulator, chromosome initiation inhibitor [Atopomonas hussainii]|uniref:LysR family transcriptional regulator, chromosome initiation inhibitor n=1 Tax=Atopomonas hussainii TaxID=1429083 RepID=A0A1H7SIU9_9GAMM|nr:LysR family transcriptional regulator ArgP [Atopomonas hussainii]SEL72435.1 LysR family transcriptional regulator, chromosome initiation inhibitor [Atopomonas hussainii]
MVDYKLLHALAAVIEQAGFERAAQQLHISQSAVSQRLRLLEARLGQAVLIRSTPPQPTALGQQLLNHWQQVRLLEAQLTRQVPSLQDGAFNNLRLAINADSLATWWPKAMASFSQRHELLLDHVVADQAVGLERMRSGEVAACICEHAQPVAGARSVYLGQMVYRAVCSPAFAQRYLPASQASGQLVASELQAAPAIVFGPDDRLQHRFLLEQGLRAEFAQHVCPASEGYVELVAAGLGYGLIPQIQIEPALASGRLLDVVTGWHLSIPLYWHHWRQGGALLDALAKHVQHVAQHYLAA